MTRNRRYSTLATLGGAALVMAGCSTGVGTTTAEAGSCSPLVESNDALAAVALDWSAEGSPEIEIGVPQAGGAVFAEIRGDGEGAAATQDSVVVANTAIFNGTTGEVLQEFGPSDPSTQGASTVAYLDAFPGLASSLECVQAGQTVLTSIPLTDLSVDTTQLPPAALGAESVLVVTQISDVLPSRAGGQTRGTSGLPQVTLAENGQPGVIFTGADAPTEFTSGVTISGTGDPIEAGETAVLRLASWDWNTREIAGDTWSSGGPGVIVAQLAEDSADPLIPSLIGENVGSQVVSVVPPNADLGLDAPQIFVIDILGTIAAPTQTEGAQ